MDLPCHPNALFFWLRHHKSTFLIDQVEGMATGPMAGIWRIADF